MRPLRDLLDTLATGRDPAPTPVGGLRGRVREVLPSAAVIAAVLLAWATAASGAQVSGPWGIVVAGAAAAPLAIAVRRSLLAWRLAWLAALAVAVADLPLVAGWWPWQPVQVIVLLVVLSLVGLRHRPGVLLWVGGFTAALPAYFVGSANRVGTMVMFLAPLLLGGLIQGMYGARRRLAAEQERSAVLTERARIARELHDVVAHHMSLIAVRAETAPYRLGDLAEPARREFGEISAASREALTEMRRLLGVLRDGSAPLTAPQPGLADLGGLVDSARSAGAVVSLDTSGDFTGLPTGVDVSAYRIIQEALSNAARHAPGARVAVAVRRAARDVAIEVTNPAAPGSPRHDAEPVVGGSGHGVRGMRERVSMLGGDLDAGPRADGGFQVRVRLPIGDGR